MQGGFMKWLLLVAGLVNLAFALFHVYLGYEISLWQSQPADVRGLMEGLNAAGALLVFFLAYACLFRRQDMLETGLGAAVFVLGAMVYLARAGEEFFWFAFKPVVFYPCLAIGLLHLGMIFGLRRGNAGTSAPPRPSLLDMAPTPSALAAPKPQTHDADTQQAPDPEIAPAVPASEPLVATPLDEVKPS